MIGTFRDAIKVVCFWEEKAHADARVVVKDVCFFAFDFLSVRVLVPVEGLAQSRIFCPFQSKFRVDFTANFVHLIFV